MKICCTNLLLGLVLVGLSPLFFGKAAGQLPDTLMATLNKLSPADKLEALAEAAQKEARRDALKGKLYWEAALTLADSLRQQPKRLDILVELASLNVQQEENDIAQTHLQAALKLANYLKNDTVLIDIYTLQGIVLERTQKYEDALDWLRKAGQLQQKLKMGPEARARNLTNIAHVYEEQKLYRKAIDTYTLAYKVCKDNGIFFGEALLSQNLANAHNALGLHRESMAYSQRSLEVALQHDLPRIVTAAYQNLGASRLALGEYEAATSLYEKAMENARRINYTKAMVDAAYQLSGCYEKRNMPAKALQALKEHMQLKDSVFSAEKAAKIETLLATFQAEQKEAAIKQLQNEKNLVRLQQQRTMLGGGALFVLLLATIWMVRYKAQKEKQAAAQEAAIYQMKQKEEARQLEQDKTLYELTALKAQMNPHFLFNALNSIQELFMTGNYTEANEYLGKFSDLTRATLEASGNTEISLAEEIQMLQDYLDLEGLRFGSNFSFALQNQTQYSAHEIAIPPMLIQPFAENAIKHGLLHLSGKKFLNIRFTLISAGVLEVNIRDNGVGREKSAYFARIRPKAHAGFAGSATQKRLELLNKNRNHAITINYVDLMKNGQPAGTEVILQIPINTMQE